MMNEITLRCNRRRSGGGRISAVDSNFDMMNTLRAEIREFEAELHRRQRRQAINAASDYAITPCCAFPSAQFGAGVRMVPSPRCCKHPGRRRYRRAPPRRPPADNAKQESPAPWPLAHGCRAPRRMRPELAYPPCALSGISGWRDGVFIRYTITISSTNNVHTFQELSI